MQPTACELCTYKCTCVCNSDKGWRRARGILAENVVLGLLG